MIKDKAVAGDISKLMLEYSAKLNASLIVVRDHCSAEDFARYRSAVGKILGEMLLEVMNPLYVEHPDLKPNEMR